MNITNPRYILYAKSHDLTPEAMLASDVETWKGGCMTGFVLWVQNNLNEFRKTNPEAFLYGNLADQNAWDKWLGEKYN